MLFNDFKTGVIYGVHRRWTRRKLYKPRTKSKKHYLGKNILYFYYPNYKTSYVFTAKYGNYSLYYCHYKYRDDYVFIELQHNAIKGKNKKEIYENTLILLDSIGIDVELLEIENKINRIDYKHDFECEYNPTAEKQAIMCICSKTRDSYNGVYKGNLIKGTGIKYKPQSSYTEIIVYDKEQERKERLKTNKSSHFELEVQEYRNVFRTELRLKSKRLYYNKKHTLKIDNTLNNYFKENIADNCFKRYVNPIFFTEPFYRLDYALLAIRSDRRLNETEADKLCCLVAEINSKGYTMAKAEYKYSSDTFDKHIKLIRSLGINPITFDTNIEIPFLLNFTFKKVSRDFTINDEEHDELRHKIFDEFGLTIEI